MTDKRGRRQFLAIAALFAAPLVAAYLFFAFPEWRPQSKTNYGQLVSPARPLPALHFVDAAGAPRDTTALNGKWSYVYLGAEICDEACKAKLFQIRQVRTLLNEKRLRVQRVYLAPDAQALAAARAVLEKEHPDLQFLAPVSTDAATVRSFFEPAEPGTLYLVDPLGNWLMSYPADAASSGLLKDIKKLLRHSQIG